LVASIEIDISLEKKFEEFEGTFERDEIMELYILNKIVKQVSIYFQ
jgi:hypothetical protein